MVGPSWASANESSAEPCLIPVAHFLAMGSYGSKCETALSKLLRKPFGPLSVLTLAIAACNPASEHWIASIRKPTRECSLGNWYCTCSAQADIDMYALRCWEMKCSSKKLLCPFQTCVCNSCSCFLISASHLSFPVYWLVSAFHAPSPSLFRWKGLMDAAYGVLRVASSRRKYKSELSLRNSAWVCNAHAINSASTDLCSMECG